MAMCNNRVVCRKAGTHRCGQCKQVFYCSKECQTAHWKTHKRQCVDITEKKRSTNSGATQTEINQNDASNFARFSREYQAYYPEDKDHIKTIAEEEIIFRSLISMEKQSGHTIYPHFFTDPKYIANRWGSAFIIDHGFREHFYQSPPKLGNIYARRSLLPYDGKYHQTMQNTSMANQIYEFGQTYVGIGYVDLFQIAWGHYKESISGKILTFYGYDSSWVTVLRSKIIYSAMKYYTEEEITTTSLLQIWFSSCWDMETSNSFDMLVKDALANPERFQLEVEKDVFILRNWQEVIVTKEEAVQEFSNEEKDLDDIWHMKSMMDRVKFLRYIFTGFIFVDEKKIICGNKTMFSDACGTTKTPGELFFKAIDLNANGFNRVRKAASLYDTIITLTHKTIYGFRAFVSMEKIICILQHKVIDPIKEPKFADTIKALSPYSIDWSSLPDYFEKNSFMRFAKACSVDGTLHTVQFNEWTTYVFGAGHTDWVIFQNKCLELYYESKKMNEAKYQMLQSKGTRSVTSFFESAPYINNINELNMFLVRRFRKIFEDFYLSDEQGNALPRSEFEEFESPLSDVLLFFQHNFNTITSTFSFSKDTKIKQAFMSPSCI